MKGCLNKTFKTQRCVYIIVSDIRTGNLGNKNSIDREFTIYLKMRKKSPIDSERILHYTGCPKLNFSNSYICTSVVCVIIWHEICTSDTTDHVSDNYEQNAQETLTATNNIVFLTAFSKLNFTTSRAAQSMLYLLYVSYNIYVVCDKMWWNVDKI